MLASHLNIPEIIYEADERFEKLYQCAWTLASEHICKSDSLPVSPYMDEACHPGRIWIWDTCFMALYCKYAHQVFPGIESLDNFYRMMYDGVFAGEIKIHHLDNPPLFAWVEYEYFQFTGDHDRIRRNLLEKKYLIRHYEWIENKARFCKKYPYAYMPSILEKRDIGYLWSSCSSGMDNTPRGYGDAAALLYWVDILAQQALSAEYIQKSAEIIGATEIAEHFKREYMEKVALLNQYYYDEADGFYYDIYAANYEFCRFMTPASFWALLAEAPDKKRAERMIRHLQDEKKFGGEIPIPSVSRDSSDFEPDGRYWRGSIWLPTSYMVLKSLEKYGKFDLAADLAEKTVRHMADVYERFMPHTIWECYSPTEILPARNKDKNVFCRPDFCGWSALGPISMMIENILGFYGVDAVQNTLKYHHRRIPGKHGIRNFCFADVCCDILIEENQVTIHTNNAFRMVVDGNVFEISVGENHFELK